MAIPEPGELMVATIDFVVIAFASARAEGVAPVSITSQYTLRASFHGAAATTVGKHLCLRCIVEPQPPKIRVHCWAWCTVDSGAMTDCLDPGDDGGEPLATMITLLAQRSSDLKSLHRMVDDYEGVGAFPVQSAAKLLVRAAGYGDLPVVEYLWCSDELQNYWRTEGLGSGGTLVAGEPVVAETPWHAAARGGHDVLIGYFRTFPLYVNWKARNLEGLRALDEAVRCGHCSTAKILADLIQGPNRALQLAAIENYTDLARILYDCHFLWS